MVGGSFQCSRLVVNLSNDAFSQQCITNAEYDQYADPCHSTTMPEALERLPAPG